MTANPSAGASLLPGPSITRAATKPAGSSKGHQHPHNAQPPPHLAATSLTAGSAAVLCRPIQPPPSTPQNAQPFTPHLAATSLTAGPAAGTLLPCCWPRQSWSPSWGWRAASVAMAASWHLPPAAAAAWVDGQRWQWVWRVGGRKTLGELRGARQDCKQVFGFAIPVCTARCRFPSLPSPTHLCKPPNSSPASNLTWSYYSMWGCCRRGGRLASPAPTSTLTCMPWSNEGLQPQGRAQPRRLPAPTPRPQSPSRP